MYIPTQEQFDKVIGVLGKANEMAKEAFKDNSFKDNRYSQVDMTTGRVDKSCGSPMCHGGWYAAVIFKGNSCLVDYSDGAEQMAADLGFGSSDDLENWADNNPEIWGNDYGLSMFSDDRAFNYSGTLTLTNIVNHWKAVAKRAEDQRINLKHNV